ncbi:MAG: hypothetical protein K2G76_09715 [Prevotella sp.]|nr:hypothetical protein [Prevotella sp.]
MKMASTYCVVSEGVVMACDSMGERMSFPYICVFVVTLDVVPAAFALLVHGPFFRKNGFYGKLFCLMCVVSGENVVSLYLQTHAGPASSMGDATRVDRMDAGVATGRERYILEMRR